MPETKSTVPALVDSRAKIAPVYPLSPGCISKGGDERFEGLLSHYSWVFKRQWWKIVLFVVVCTLMAFAFSMRLTPVYKSTATIDVDRQVRRGTVGQGSPGRSLDDTDNFLASQIKLIQSDSVLLPVALRFNLLSEEQHGRNAVKRAESPVFLKGLTVMRPRDTYLLQISYHSTDPHLAAEVANAIAASFVEHTYDIRIRADGEFASFMEKQVQAVKARMEKSNLALARFERDANSINPDVKINIFSARLSQLEAEYTKAEANRILKEAGYNSVKSGSSEVDWLPDRGERLKLLTGRLNTANEKFAVVKAKFAANRGEYKRAAALVTRLTKQLDRTRRDIVQQMQQEYRQAAGRARLLGNQLAAMKAEFDRINARSFEQKSLQREAEADRKSYQEVVQKVEEFGKPGSFQQSAIRLADAARPALRPVFPNLRLNVLLACLLASILGIAAAIIADLLDNTVRDAEQAQKAFEADVIGTLPLARSRGALLSGKDKLRPLMRWQDPNDKGITGYAEAIRTLRNSIALRSMDRRLKSILITSAEPLEGKSSTAVHLALAHAEQRRKTLLIDCDLRKSSIHRYFDVSNSVGMTNVVTEGMPWRDAVARVDQTPELHLLLAGPSTRTAPDLVGREIASIIAEAEREYDLVLVDAPPMFGFAEPLQIATYVGGLVIVTVAGQTNRLAVVTLLNTMNRLRIHVTGIVLNKAKASKGRYYYGYCGRDANLKKA